MEGSVAVWDEPPFKALDSADRTSVMFLMQLLDLSWVGLKITNSNQTPFTSPCYPELPPAFRAGS